MCSDGHAAATSAAASADEPPSFAAFPDSLLPDGFLPYQLRKAWDVTPDTRHLRFRLPDGVQDIAVLGSPSVVKVRREIAGHLLDKSYSPVSLPDAKGHLDLIVKRYPPRPGGGLGAFLCDMQPGDEVDMKLRPERHFNGSPYRRNRFSDVTMIGNGTGVAPLLQLARVILEDPADHTKVHFLAAHRSEEDVIGSDWLSEWSSAHPSRFRCRLVLSQPVDADACRARGDRVGRLDREGLEAFVPRAGSGALVVVCGTDGFLDAVCGDKIRIPVAGQSKPRKVQGPVRGALRDLGFEGSGAVVARL